MGFQAFGSPSTAWRFRVVRCRRCFARSSSFVTCCLMELADRLQRATEWSQRAAGLCSAHRLIEYVLLLALAACSRWDGHHRLGAVLARLDRVLEGPGRPARALQPVTLGVRLVCWVCAVRDSG